MASHKALFVCLSKPGVTLKPARGLRSNRRYRKNFVIQEIYFNIVCLFEKMLPHFGLTVVSVRGWEGNR